MKYILFLLCLLPLFVDGQIITTFAGSGLGGSSGDGASAAAAKIPNPAFNCTDKYGNFYIASNAGGNRIRKIDVNGIITTIAGTGTAGFSGDGGPATDAKFNLSQSVQVDSYGNVYVADLQNHRIRKIDATNGFIQTVAGNGIAGYSGDGGPATAASIYGPQSILLDRHGNLFIADYYNSRVRKVNSLGIISTFAGNGILGYSGDGLMADTCKIGGVFGMCTDKLDNIYLADGSNSRIFKINPAGIIFTVAGTDTGTLYNGDEMYATSANISPIGVAIDSMGNLYIGERYNFRVRKVGADGIIHTVAGTGISGYSGDNGPATAAQFNYPSGITLDTCGTLYISDAGNGRVRKVTFDTSCGKPATNNHTGIASSPVTHSMIYPNPALNEIHIDGITIAASYTLTDMVGMSVQHGALRVGDNTIDISGVSKGVYLVTVISEDGLLTVYKLPKQ